MSKRKSAKFSPSVFKSVNIDRVYRGFQRFSDDTNITGFKELYYAKSLVFKSFWFALILFGVCFTTYQCCYTIMEYVNEPTNTVVQQLRVDPEYPQLKLCFAHWLFWLDWQKFLNANLNNDMNRDSFLYSMSYAKTVFMDRPMENVTDAKIAFETMMSTRKYKNLSDYYLSIARDSPLGIKGADSRFAQNLTKRFHDYYGSEFCYVWSVVNFVDGKSNPNARKSGGGQSLKLRIDFRNDIRIDYVSDLEMNFYRRAAFAYESSNDSRIILYGNETEIYVSPMIYADGTDDQVIPDPNYFQYILRLKANVYKWKSTSDRPCTDNYGIDFGGKFLRNCLKYCEVSSRFNSTANNYCTPFKNAVCVNYAGKICRQDFVLVNPTMNGNVETVVAGDVEPSTSDDDVVSNEYSKCADRCERPCEQWLYETSTVTNLRPYQFRSSLPSTTDVEIQYPSPDTIVVMQEIPSQTWQKMLSDVGGLLGLWMGATIFSFFQILYLCCCGETDEYCASRKLNKINADETSVAKNAFHIEVNNLNFTNHSKERL